MQTGSTYPLAASGGRCTFLVQDDEDGKESRGGLDHPDLAVRHGNQTIIDKLVAEGVSWLLLHDVGFWLVGHGDGGYHVGAEVATEDGDGAEVGARPSG